MSPGVDGKTFDGMNLARVNKIINSMKDHSYHPSPARRTYIPQKSGNSVRLAFSPAMIN